MDYPLHLNIFISFLFIYSLLPFASPKPLQNLQRDSFIGAGDDSDVLVSPQNIFACGFYKIGSNSYVFSIWYTVSNNTIVWTANRDHPVNGYGSRIAMKKDGTLALTDFDGTVVWSTETSSSSSLFNSTSLQSTTSTTSSNIGDHAQLLDSGNLVVKDRAGLVLWQSFDYPTDTLLPTQPFTKSSKLVSAAANGLVLSGYYSFFFDNDNVLRFIYDGPEFSSIYWPNPDLDVFDNGRTKYNSSRFAVLDNMGGFISSDQFAFNASDMGYGIKRRLTMGYDGNLRLFSLNESTGTWRISWIALTNICFIHGLCGRNGICVHDESEPKCSCPPGFEMRDQSDWRKGCERRASLICDNSHELEFVPLLNTDFYGFDLNYTKTTLNDCEEQCLQSCACEAFGYKFGTGECYPKAALFNGKSGRPGANNNIFLKLAIPPKKLSIATSQVSNLICNATASDIVLDSSSLYDRVTGRMKWVYFYSFIAAFFVIELMFIMSGWFFLFRKEQIPSATKMGYEAVSSHFRRFTYNELVKATKSFKETLGTGGSGSVYKGVLDDGRDVAVKKLEDEIQEEEFQAELSVLCSINHKNLVKVVGYCSEKARKLMVSEFVENGSLDKLLFDAEGVPNSLGWSVRFNIAVGVAKGLAYLHHECLEWIIHCDVKPENILLDREFQPKIADFGLAKLLNRDGTGANMSRIQGTRGYIAPEWASSLPITGKADVYSYGVVLLELLRGIRVSDWAIDGERDVEMVLRIFLDLLKERIESGVEWIEDFIDTRLNGDFNREQAIMIVKLAVLCLEEDRTKRPTMASLVHLMLSSSHD